MNSATAVAEFTRVIDLLGEPEDIPEFLEKIKDKFASAELYNQLEIAMRALDVKGMISGLRALGYEVSNDFNGKYTDYRVLKDQRVHVLSGAGQHPIKHERADPLRPDSPCIYR